MTGRDPGAGKPHQGAFVAYVRVSTDAQGESGLGQEAQMETIRRHLDGGDLVATYSDVVSGTRDDRSGLIDALRHCERAGCALIVSHMDRLGRKAATLLAILGSGVNIVVCDTPVDYAGSGRAFLQMRAIMAEEFGRTIREKTKNALGAKRRRGERLGAQTVDGQPDWERRAKRGAERKTEIADKFALEVMAPIIDAYQAHRLEEYGEPANLTQIKEFLNREGAPTFVEWQSRNSLEPRAAQAKRARWHVSTVRNLTARLAKIENGNQPAKNRSKIERNDTIDATHAAVMGT